MVNTSISQTAVSTATPITPLQFEQLLKTAVYDPTGHTLNMIVQVPAGQNRQTPESHLVDWRSMTPAGIRLEMAGGWPVLGAAIRERSNGDVVAGLGLADRSGGRFAHAGSECPHCGRTFQAHEVIDANGRCLDKDDCLATAAAHKTPLETPAQREERLGQYRNARNLQQAVRLQGQAERNKVHQAAAAKRAADLTLTEFNDALFG
jgi:hypothetical protein